jgi:hypothetical protein
MSIFGRIALVTLGAAIVSDTVAQNKANTTPREDHRLKSEIYEEIRRIREEYNSLVLRYQMRHAATVARYDSSADIRREGERLIQQQKDKYKTATGCYYS